MPVLILKNTRSEGPGTIGDYLEKAGVSCTVVELAEAEVPPGLDGFDTLIILGGPMAVYEMDEYPHLMIGSRLIREAINRGMKVLGVCLGAQLIAHCLGARVYKGMEKEIGWLPIELTGGGLKDPLMRRLALHPHVGDFWKKFQVFHWHGDAFELPMGAERLAGSALYENQAFRYGENIYAFQFHIEVTKEMVYDWFKGDPILNRIVPETERVYEEYSGRAQNFYQAFFRSNPERGRVIEIFKEKTESADFPVDKNIKYGRQT